MKYIITILLCISLILLTDIAVGYQTYHSFSPRFFDTASHPDVLVRNVIFASAMLAGIAVGHLYNFFQMSPQNTVDKALFKSAFGDKRLWLSLLASPLVFGAVYILNERQPSTVMATLLAFENGFFCNALLKARTKPDTPTPRKR